MRTSINDYYLSVAKAVSKRSTCITRQYGAVIVKDGEIIATGYNGSPRGSVNCCDIGHCERYGNIKWGDSIHSHNDGNYDTCQSVHAEMNAMLSASRKEMIGSTLYLYGEEQGHAITCEPCPICSRLIKNAGIEAVICSKNE